MPKVSPLASVDPAAHLADDIEIGPFCVIGPAVTIGAGCRLLNNVTIVGQTRVGKNNTFFPNSVIGTVPQDLKYHGEPTHLEIGDGNTIREAVTINIGTPKGGGVTRLGSNNLLMVNVHLGHDTQFGDRNIIANNVMIAGHVICGNNVVMNGLVGIHQFVTIGDFAYLVGAARIHHDVPPFVKVSDDDKIRALNSVGLRRAGFGDEEIEALESAVKRLFLLKEQPFAKTMAEFNTENGLGPNVKKLIQFLRNRDAGKHGRYLEGLRAK